MRRRQDVYKRQAQASANQGATAVSAVTDVSGIVENAMPSIVAINDTMTVEQRDFFGMPQTYTAQSSGSGIIVNQTDTELLIATNNHVAVSYTHLDVYKRQAYETVRLEIDEGDCPYGASDFSISVASRDCMSEIIYL